MKNEINKELKKYIEKNIFPIYDKNEEGHGITHIKYVIDRSLKFAKQFDSIDLNMVYTIASFHDIAHHIDKDKHEILSARFFYENEEMKKFFNNRQRIIIKEAIEDHRASLEYVPRSDYGKIVSSADRETNIYMPIKRTYQVILKHYPNLSEEEIVERAYLHLLDKYGKNGYSKSYVEDDEYEKFINDIRLLLQDKELFHNWYTKINGMNLSKKRKLIKLKK